VPVKTTPPSFYKWAAAHPLANGGLAFLMTLYGSFVFRQALWFGAILAGATGVYVWIGWREGGYIRGVAEKRYGPLD
jgi:hypothetical protein